METIKPHAVAGGDEPASPLQQNRWTETSVARGKGGLQNFINFCSRTVSLWMSEPSVREHKEKNDFQQQSGQKPTRPGFHKYSITVSIFVFFFSL